VLVDAVVIMNVIVVLL